MKTCHIYIIEVPLMVLALIFILTISGCKKSAFCDCFKGTGKEITETRSISPFYDVELYKKVDLHFHYNVNYRITVTAGEKLIDKVTTEIDNGVLKIDNHNKCNWVRDFDNKFIVDIYTPEVKTIEVRNSSGSIFFDDTMHTERFRFESWGSTGDYHLKLNCGTAFLSLQTGPASLYAEGKIGVGYLWNSGGGRFDALSLQSDDIYTTNLGTNDVLIFPQNLLEATIAFSGNIYYKGNPPVLKLEEKGTGKFIAL